MVPIPPKGKGPTELDWHRRAFDAKSFGNHNVGLVLGTRSGGLVDVDLDSPVAVELADDFLPATGMVHGRPGKRRSHRWYRLSDAPEGVLAFRGPKGMLVELRSGSLAKGSQTLAPPSRHPSGEELTWEADGAPAELTFNELEPCVRRLAAASLLASVFPSSGRHVFCLALSGVLLRGGMPQDLAEAFVFSVAKAGGSSDPAARAAVVRATAQKLADGEQVTGIPSLVKAIPAAPIDGVFPADIVTTALEHLALQGGPEETYSPDRVEAYAKACKLTRTEYEASLFVQDGRSGTMWVRDGETFRPPIHKQHAEIALRQFLGTYPFAPGKKLIQRKGQEDSWEDVEKTDAQKVKDHTALATTVKASYVVERSTWDPKTSTFIERLAPVRGVLPAYDPQVAEWLELLGGKEAPKLLDWLASVPNLSEQSAALYLCGEGGAGKGMLAAGLARIWTTGKPVDLAGVLGSFQDDLARCPLVFADESLAGDDTSAKLRALIGTTGLHLNRKHLSALPIEGAIRLMIAGNNDGLLAFTETLTERDINALGIRFLKVDVGEPPKHFLEKLGGYEVTRSWVEGDKIAAHVLWLSETRAVTRGKRFIVDGNVEEVAKIIRKHSKVEQLALSVVMDALQGNVLPCPVVVDKDARKVWVYGRGVAKAIRMQDHGKITERAITLAVANVCTKQMKNTQLPEGGRFWCRELDFEVFEDWAEHVAGVDVDMLISMLGFEATVSM